MKRILIASTRSPSYDAIRVRKPLAWPGVKQALWDHGIHTEIMPMEALSLSVLHGVDCLVLHGVPTVSALNMLRKLPCRFAMFQDDLMRVDVIPSWNPNKIDAAKERGLDWCLENCCAIVATTETLKFEYAWPDKTIVMGNLEDFGKRPPERIEKAAVYVGGSSHAGDLDLLNDFRWSGTTTVWANCLPSAWTAAYRDPQGNLSLRPNRQELGHIEATMDYERYEIYLKNIAPLFSVGLAPLVDNRFNRAKSILKFLEYTKNGWVSAISGVPPYCSIPDECCAKVAPGRSWKDAVEYAYAQPEIATRAFDWCFENHSYQKRWEDWVGVYRFIAARI